MKHKIFEYVVIGYWSSEELRHLVYKGSLSIGYENTVKPLITLIVLLVVYSVKVCMQSFCEENLLIGPSSEKIDLAWIETGVQLRSNMKGRRRLKRG